MKDIHDWIIHVEAVRSEMDSLAKRLEEYGAMVVPCQTSTVGDLPYVARFQFQDAVTTVYFLLKDHQTESDVVITNMTTLPIEHRSDGYGSKALQLVLKWATANGLTEVRGTQVHNDRSESFLERNGFKKYPKPNPCNDFVYITTDNSGRPDK